MKFQELFFLFALIALTSANIYDELLDFDRETNEKLNITAVTIPIITYMTTATTSTSTTTTRPIMTTMPTTTATTTMPIKMPTLISPSKCNVLFFY